MDYARGCFNTDCDFGYCFKLITPTDGVPVHIRNRLKSKKVVFSPSYFAFPLFPFLIIIRISLRISLIEVPIFFRSFFASSILPVAPVRALRARKVSPFKVG